MTDVAALDTAGHRGRLRDRLLSEGADALSDHEVVEYLLSLAILRRDTKPLAKRLLREFVSLEKLLAAPVEELVAVDEMGPASAASLKIVQAVVVRMLRKRVEEKPVLASWEALVEYLHADMAYLDTERVRVLHLDTKNQLLRDIIVSEGSVDQAAIYVREVIRAAMQLGSAALILVHNHPSGDPTPSRQDIALTREIVQAGKPLGILIHDHVIIGATGHSSMRALGLI